MPPLRSLPLEVTPTATTIPDIRERLYRAFRDGAGYPGEPYPNYLREMSGRYANLHQSLRRNLVDGIIPLSAEAVGAGKVAGGCVGGYKS